MPRVIISEPGKKPQPYRFKLERTTINIGRGNENDIVIECGSCSTHHCVIERVEGGYILTDAGSTNGTKLNGELMEVIDLHDKMEVFVGDIPLEFNLSEEEIAALSQETFTSHQRKKLPPIEEPPTEDVYNEEATPLEEVPQATHAPSPKQSNDTLKTILILILMLLGVAAGFSIRHYQETGQFLPTEKTSSPVQTDSSTQETPPSAE